MQYFFVLVMSAEYRCQLRTRPSLPCVTLTVEQCQFIVIEPNILGFSGHAFLKSNIEIFIKIVGGGGGRGTLKGARHIEVRSYS